MRRGMTLVEVLVVVATFAAAVGVLAGCYSTYNSATRLGPVTPPESWALHTVQHEGHWWVTHPEAFTHHPDCPCRHRALAEGE
jgi:hypothetical protein